MIWTDCGFMILLLCLYCRSKCKKWEAHQGRRNTEAKNFNNNTSWKPSRQMFWHQYSSIDVVINPSTLQRVLITARGLFLVLVATQHGFELCFEFLGRWALGFLGIVSGWSNWWGLICTHICLDCLNSNIIYFLRVFLLLDCLEIIYHELVPWQLQH